MPVVHPASLQSLCLELIADGQVLGSATGFMMDAGSHPFLVTNWHVVSGRDTGSGEHLWGTAPDAVRIHHHGQGGPGRAIVVNEPLVDAYGQPLWSEHPVWGPRVDVVALPLTQLHDVTLHCRRLVDLDRDEAGLSVMTDVSVVGFPFGHRKPGEPAIWTRGSVATDPEADYDDRPCFLVDARTGTGQVGAPVLVRNDPPAPSNGSGPAGHLHSHSPGTRLVGVYSGRVADDLDLGLVWRSSALVEVLVNAQSTVILQRFSD